MTPAAWKITHTGRRRGPVFTMRHGGRVFSVPMRPLATFANRATEAARAAGVEVQA